MKDNINSKETKMEYTPIYKVIKSSHCIKSENVSKNWKMMSIFEQQLENPPMSNH